jgi:manganese efflux pump family protein
MGGWTVIGIALGLAMDAFAVAVAAGLSLSTLTGRHIFRLAFHFGLFQMLMPILGYLAGRAVAGWLEPFAPWFVFAILAGLGAKMLWEARQIEKPPATDPTRGWRMVGLSLAVSIDALGVGVSLALLNVSVWMPSLLIGMITGVLTIVGMELGQRVGRRFSVLAELLGGLVLITIGLKFLIEHLRDG